MFYHFNMNIIRKLPTHYPLHQNSCNLLFKRKIFIDYKKTWLMVSLKYIWISYRWLLRISMVVFPWLIQLGSYKSDATYQCEEGVALFRRASLQSCLQHDYWTSLLHGRHHKRYWNQRRRPRRWMDKNHLPSNPQNAHLSSRLYGRHIWLHREEHHQRRSSKVLFLSLMKKHPVNATGFIYIQIGNV